MTTAMAFGTFDLLHPGHLSYLKQAKGMGERLVVVVATDLNVEKGKGKKPVNNQEERRKKVGKIVFVDEAIIGEEKDLLKIIEKTKPEIIALGYDQKPGEEELAKKFLKRGIGAKIVRLKPYKEKIYKSSKIREIINSKKTV